MAVRHAETPWPTARPAPGNKLANRAAIWPAIGLGAKPEPAIAQPAEPERAIGLRAEAAPATGQPAAGPTALEAGIFRAAVAEAGMPSEGAPGDTTVPALAPPAAVVLPAWDLAAAAAVGEAVVVGAADKPEWIAERIQRSTVVNSTSANGYLSRPLWIVRAVAWACLSASVLLAAQQSAEKKAPPASAGSTAGAKSFDTPQQAAAALIAAAEEFEVRDLIDIFGPGGDDIVLTGEYAQDRQRAVDFAAEAHEKTSVSVEPKTGNRAFLIVGQENWPFPVPIVKRGDKWAFDAKAGRQELLYRRIGRNELDAIQICRGYVEAQEEYSFQKREGYDVNQYAQRIVSTPGKQDGLAWQNPDGTWGGPIGEKIARAIEQGYTSGAEPYHGYFFKILKGQGPAAPLGEMDFVVKGVMIGGFALVAAPAEYRVTGVKTFMVSQDGVVYQKDFGPASLEEFKRMERFNPDKSWTPVLEENE